MLHPGGGAWTPWSENGEVEDERRKDDERQWLLRVYYRWTWSQGPECYGGESKKELEYMKQHVEAWPWKKEKYNYCKETGVRSNDSFSRQENLCMCECRRELQTLMYIKGLLLKCTFWFSRSGGKAWNSAFQTSFPMMLQVCGLHLEKQKYRELGIRKRMMLKVWQKKKRWKLEIPRQCSSLVPYIKPCSQQRGTRQYCGVIWGHSDNLLRILEEYSNQRLI